MEEAKKATPTCITKCCKPVPVPFNEFAAPKLTCASGSLDPFSGKCTSGTAFGYEACPAGTQACFLASWHRPLCAVPGKVSGLDSCKVFEALAALHKLPKVACS
jgi:hypothetical protein